MKSIHFWVRNITEEDYAIILKLAVAKTGRASLSALAKSLVMEHLRNHVTTKKNITRQRKRLQIRLDDDTQQCVDNLAQTSHMTANQFVAMLVEQYVSKNPTLTTAEITALYKSNQQLLMIGRNLNQIAKALNSNTATELSTKTLNELREIIDKHTDTVSHLISANYDRMP